VKEKRGITANSDAEDERGKSSEEEKRGEEKERGGFEEKARTCHVNLWKTELSRTITNCYSILTSHTKLAVTVRFPVIKTYAKAEILSR